MSISSTNCTNDNIADLFDDFVYWMTASGNFDNYKISTYRNAAFVVRNADYQLCTASPSQIIKVKGIGESLRATIIRICQKGEFPEYEELMQTIPEGVVQMSQINGLGPKKINSLWREYGITSIDALQQMIDSGNLEKIKGYGKKTVEKINQNIQWMRANRNKHLYASVAALSEDVLKYFASLFPDFRFSLVGDIARQENVIGSIDVLTDADSSEIKEDVSLLDKLKEVSKEQALLEFDGVEVRLIFAPKDDFDAQKEEINFKVSGQKYDTTIPLFQVGEYYGGLRPTADDLITDDDVRGLIHCHTNYSDGTESIESMAQACIDRGLEYMVLSDHSQSAFYANGLDPERVKKQHDEIFKLNKKLAPFRIFKSIESDILSDGSLDYEEDVLAEFDIVIGSVHSGLSMDERTATTRLVNAIKNPYMKILGHMTGRLLIKREGYPVDIEAIADACVEHRVAMEINANPRRLDVDHSYWPYLLSRGIMTSINPDAHTIEGIDDIRWGVINARKGGVGKMNNISSFTLDEFVKYFDII